MAPRRSWAKANNPYWSTHVATWYRGHQTAEVYCRRRKLSTAAFEQWARHLLSPENLRKRAKDLQELRRKSWNRRVDRRSDAGAAAVGRCFADRTQ